MPALNCIVALIFQTRLRANAATRLSYHQVLFEMIAHRDDLFVLDEISQRRVIEPVQHAVESQGDHSCQHLFDKLKNSKIFGAFGAWVFLITTRVPRKPGPRWGRATGAASHASRAPCPTRGLLPHKPVQGKRVKVPSATCRPSRGGNRDSRGGSLARRCSETPTGSRRRRRPSRRRDRRGSSLC